MAYIPTYHNATVGSVNVNYIEAGSQSLPNLLLLHGFPSSSNQFRDLIPLLSDSYHIIAPDLPGFGLTKTPADFVFTFDNLADVIGSFVAQLSWTSYAMYIFDYGAPVGLRLALQDPTGVKAIISQNGNAYVEGLGHPFWTPVEELWNSNNSQPARDTIRTNFLTLAGTKYQYEEGTPADHLDLINPLAYHLDYIENIAGHEERQLDLMYDYRTNLPLYPKFQEYFRKSQVPLLAVWGKEDPCFIPPGATAFKRDSPKAIVHFVDAGHFALETQRWEIARQILHFLAGVTF
ncbi:alpha/beta-hydrolase [Polychaeton citri CBS 116435]|uniref:Alpha/beta-hydrolase n=1 Tax=Polychaeton citri CBS 116435 TaxID=1314669 RepID=A0A9P4QAP4_9PEZI|nr:alpha/beta-hydrolase [Polychaeton citri CBS 116435]